MEAVLPVRGILGGVNNIMLIVYTNWSILHKEK